MNFFTPIDMLLEFYAIIYKNINFTNWLKIYSTEFLEHCHIVTVCLCVYALCSLCIRAVHETNAPHEELYIAPLPLLLVLLLLPPRLIQFSVCFALYTVHHRLSPARRFDFSTTVAAALLKFFPHTDRRTHRQPPPPLLQSSNFSYIHTYNGVIRTYFSECLCKNCNWQSTKRGRGTLYNVKSALSM